MLDELWDIVATRLTPDITHFSYRESAPLEKQIAMFLEYPSAAIDWKKYPKNIRFYDAAEIIPLLEQLLARPFDDTVYVYAPDNYTGFLKVPLRKFLEGRYKFVRPMWIWNPTEGYMIEERSLDYSTIGLIPKMYDPIPKFELKKDSFSDGTFSFRHHLRQITADFGVSLIDEREANKILALFLNIAPRTIWGRLDWNKIKIKKVIGENPDQIIVGLTQLLGNLTDFTVYIEWSDEELPLAKTDLRHILANYRQTIGLSLETILFNLETSYVIEIDASNKITIGILPRNNP